MSIKQSYELLGLSIDADLNDIKIAMKNLMIKHHPYPYNNIEKLRYYNELCVAYRKVYSYVLTFKDWVYFCNFIQVGFYSSRLLGVSD